MFDTVLNGIKIVAQFASLQGIVAAYKTVRCM